MDLFDRAPGSSGLPRTEHLGPGAVLLRGFAGPSLADIVGDLRKTVAIAPFRHMITPGGFRMSVAMSNCGALGWVSDRSGYRYSREDPGSGRPWPPMPDSFRTPAESAAAAAGFQGFAPDACLINRYDPGARMTLHQDKNERDFSQPIVSVSLGLAAVFLFGGESRSDRPARVRLAHGDVVVWGGPSRLVFHGVMPMQDGVHPLLGPHRFNLTFRKAG
ncbi:DNA oxidative demethylase AlkB [Vulgatibacter incomptus]|uniref:Alkylated DNA repair protein AlkB n=1 Tax=Vulgatibacter incomptus TaxID=1391653 RepID=A0A0K1PIK1_9BACT|nr:DNA oxidative demethylase AlkB [Vulgatibacter incomptus]AKU93216.1 Alkylated DNA repair protein AlkB [Vulgatibacter incomptus]